MTTSLIEAAYYKRALVVALY